MLREEQRLIHGKPRLGFRSSTPLENERESARQSADSCLKSEKSVTRL